MTPYFKKQSGKINVNIIMANYEIDPKHFKQSFLPKRSRELLDLSDGKAYISLGWFYV
jgi:hypothetical protein